MRMRSSSDIAERLVVVDVGLKPDSEEKGKAGKLSY